MGRVHIATQAYGSEEIRVQALYAAWSALAWRGDRDVAVHVYTDAPEEFAPLAAAIDVCPMSPARIAEWRGPVDFVHRLKAAMVQDVVRRFPAEPLLYVDADVFFTRPVDEVFSRIGPGRGVLHLKEYEVATSDKPQMRKFRRALSRLTFRGKPIDLTAAMWNAGAMGMDPAQFGIVQDWLAFIDEVYPHYRRGLVEQYSCGYFLQKATTVSPCDDVLFHYWYQKEDYVAAIRAELEVLRARPLEEALAHLRDHRLALPPPERRKHRTSFWQRLRGALEGRR